MSKETKEKKDSKKEELKVDKKTKDKETKSSKETKSQEKPLKEAKVEKIEEPSKKAEKEVSNISKEVEKEPIKKDGKEPLEQTKIAPEIASVLDPIEKALKKPEKKDKAPIEEEILKEPPTFEGILLFNKWSYKDIIVNDIGLKTYICLRPVITPHTGGRYEHQRFKKAEMPIVERLVNKLMRKQTGTGKKERMINAVKIAFEMIYLKTGNNPIQVFIDALQNAAPREEVTRITYGGMAQLQSVDIAPMRRLDIALTNIVEGVYKKSFNNILTAQEILASELIDASENKTASFAINKMQEIERVALSAR